MSDADVPLLALEGIKKSFGGVHALTDGTLEVRAGQIHALLGENGAGKSTLVKIIAGAHEADAGRLLWRGEPREIRSFHEAEALGIRVIYQQLNILNDLTVAENVTLGRERSHAGFLDLAEQRRRARAAIGALGIDLPPSALAGTLRVAEKQLIEIARALWGDVRLVIMDEPTASLGEREVDRLFSIIRKLRDQGVAIVFISHKLDEVFQLADQITVLRDGFTVGSSLVRETTRDELVTLMVGHSLGHTVARTSHAAADEVLRVDDIETDAGLSGVSFSLRRGEVLGVYGLLGSGRTELARAIFGADPLRAGTITMNGRVMRFRSPADARRQGLGLVTEQRAEAAFPFLSIGENLSAASADLISRFGFIGHRRERVLASSIVSGLRVRMRGLDEQLNRLSGGNQQKVMVGRWLMRRPKVLILDDPTSGIDVGAKDEMYRLIEAMTAEGTAVVMTSSELPELLAVADRMLVMHRGRAVALLDRDAMTEAAVLRAAVGEAEVGPG